MTPAQRKLWITAIFLFAVLIILIIFMLYSSFNAGYEQGIITCIKTYYQNSSFLPNNPLLK